MSQMTVDTSGVWDNDSQSWVNPDSPDYASIVDQNSSENQGTDNYGAVATGTGAALPVPTSSSDPTVSAAPAQPADGLPTPSDISADAPAPLQDFGATPTVTPTYASATGYNATTVDPNASYGYLQQEENANAASLQPTFQAQDQTNQDQLAARGISSSGSAAEITNQLQQGQGATLAGMDAPAIAAQAGYTQADITGNAASENTAAQYNATNAQTTNTNNVNSANAATAANAGYYDQAITGDATNYNNYLSTLEGQGYNTGNEGYTAYLNSFDPNSGVTSSYNSATAGIGNAATGAYDSSVEGEGAALGGVASAAGTAFA